MAPITALAFLLSGLGLWRASPGRFLGSLGLDAEERSDRLFQGLAALVLVIALLSAGSRLFGWRSNLDLLIFEESPGTAVHTSMALGTATTFLLLGMALLMARAKRPTGLFQSLALLGALLGWLGFSHYLFGGEPLLPYAQMAVHTSLLFLILTAGILAVRADIGLAALLTASTAGGTIARRLVPDAIFAPMIFGWLRLQGQYAGW